MAAGVAGSLGPMEPRPPADPSKLLSQWMAWERGEETPGRVMANLKTSGMRELLEALNQAAAAEAGAAPTGAASPR